MRRAGQRHSRGERGGPSPPPISPLRARFAAAGSGRLAVGDHVLDVSPEHGAIVHVAPSGGRARVRARPSPVLALPPDGRELVGRAHEVRRALDALDAGRAIEFHGPPGAGKTALLRHLVDRGEARPPGGAVYCRAAGRSLEDLLVLLFDAFYEADRSYLPTPGELTNRLAAISALVAVDDLDMGGEEADRLLGALPRCRVAAAATEPRLREGADVVELAGLSEEAALDVLESELERPLRDEERAAAAEVCRRVGGRPLGILQAAAAVRQGDASLPRLAAQPVLLAGTNRGELRALGVLAGLRDAPVSARHVAGIAELRGAGEVLEGLRERRLVEAHPSGYVLTAPLPLEAVDPDRWALRALDHFAGWAPWADPAQVVEDADAVLAALHWGAGRGRWASVLTLARALDPPLAMSGRWGSWRAVSEAALAAARASEARAAEGWALNQLGARALGLGDRDDARGFLDESLRVREEIGDAQGAAVTRHNLGVLDAAPSRGWRGVRGRWPEALAVTGAIVGAVVGVMLARGDLGRPDSTETAARTTRVAPRAAPSPRPPVTPPPAAAPPASTRAPEPRPDLVVLRARYVPGGGCTVRWIVRNRGDATARASTTALQYDLAYGGSGQVTEDVPPLRPGASRSQRKVSTGYSCAQFASLTVRADTNGRVAEVNERNNRARATR